MKLKVLKASLACVPLAGCAPEIDSLHESHFRGSCKVEEWYQNPGIMEFKNSNIRQEGVNIKGFANCPSWTKISVRAYGPDGKLAGIGDDFIHAGVFMVFVETYLSRVETVKFRIDR